MGRLRSWARIAAGATSNFRHDQCFDRAAVIAYFALLSFLPLVVILVAMGALFLGSLDAAERGTELVFRNVLYALPPSVMAHVRFLQEGIWSGAIYLPLTLWSASMVFSKIESSMDRVFGVERRRHWALRKLLAFGVVGGLSVLLVLGIILGGILATVERFIDSSALAPLRDAPFYQLVNGFVSRYLVPWLVTVVAFFFVYRIVPARAVPASAALLAAGIAGSLWEVLKIGLTYYVATVASFTQMYGALATVVVFLLWVNASVALLLWGGELAAILSGFREGAAPPRG